MIDFLDIIWKSEVQVWRLFLCLDLINLHGSYIKVYIRWKVNFKW